MVSSEFRLLRQRSITSISDFWIGRRKLSKSNCKLFVTVTAQANDFFFQKFFFSEIVVLQSFSRVFIDESYALLVYVKSHAAVSQLQARHNRKLYFGN